MPDVVGVRFKPCGKIYDFEADGITLNKGDLVVVESELGLNIGNVVVGSRTMEDHEKRLKKIMRKATEEDLLQKQANKTLETEASENCLERIMARGLAMKLISTEATLDKKRIIFYFTAEKRIDFRELVKDLASKFKTRIEMRQIGVRDGARIIGNLGICGLEVCCKKFLTAFEPISIKMAKKQELVLNTGKLSGACGRLMCCLGYEYSDTAPEDTGIETDLPVAEEEETVELVVASLELPAETPEPPQSVKPAGQEPGTETSSPPPADSREQKEKRRRWYPRRRRKKPPKK